MEGGGQYNVCTMYMRSPCMLVSVDIVPHRKLIVAATTIRVNTVVI